MFCLNCGKEQIAEAKFCQNCGKPNVLKKSTERVEKEAVAEKNSDNTKQNKYNIMAAPIIFILFLAIKPIPPFLYILIGMFIDKMDYLNSEFVAISSTLVAFIAAYLIYRKYKNQHIKILICVIILALFSAIFSVIVSSAAVISVDEKNKIEVLRMSKQDSHQTINAVSARCDEVKEVVNEYVNKNSPNAEVLEIFYSPKLKSCLYTTRVSFIVGNFYYIYYYLNEVKTWKTIDASNVCHGEEHCAQSFNDLDALNTIIKKYK